MNEEPHDFNPLHEPMDTGLLQLERELFSLTPVETPRCLASRLDGQICSPVSIVRNVPANVVPFRWSKIVIPAAAAVVVVSVLNRLDGPAGSLPSEVSQTGIRSEKLATPVIERTTGYVLRAEPIFATPAGWESAEHQYWVPTSPAAAVRFTLPRRSAVAIPASFH